MNLQSSNTDCNPGSHKEIPEVPNNPQAPQGRLTGDLVLAWLNHELALEMGLLDAQRVRTWAAGLTEDEAERLLEGLWEWDMRLHGNRAAAA